jgi:hypothetical protein
MKENIKQKHAYDTATTVEEERFIRNYGGFNCKYLWLKPMPDVMDVLQREYPTEDFSPEIRNFIRKNEGKKVLCHIVCGNDVFICGDDNTPFPVACFETI